MPKATKKAKEKKADFQKTKLKLGKGKQPAVNATNTAFTSKAVGLPVQNIGGAEGRAGQPTTKRGQTLDGLLVQLGHYSANVRKDALAGLKELLSLHGQLLSLHLGVILKPLAKLIADDDAGVRKSVLAFMDWLLPSVDYDYLSPFLPLLLFSTTSALTHIFPEVRIDGLKTLDILLSVSPQAVTEGWSASTSTGSSTHGQRVLEAYLSILHVRGGQGGPTTPAARLIALRSFGRFLRVALFPSSTTEREEVEMPAWFFATSFAASHDFAAFVASMEPESRTPSRAWDAEAMHIDDFGLTRSDVVGLALSDLHNAIEEALRGNQGTSASGQQTAATLLTLLHPVLNSTFLEAAPTAFAPSANATAGPHRGVALCAVRIARDLWRANAAEGSQAAKADIKASRTLVDKMAAYFPFAGDDNMAYRKDSEAQETLQELDLIYCELVSLLVLSSASSNDSKSVASFAQVANYVSSLLSKQGGVPLSAQAYVALAPTLWTLLNSPTGSDEVFTSLVEHFASSNSSSGVKRVSLVFLSHCIEASVSPAFVGAFRPAAEVIDAFYVAIPRMLWDLQTRDASLSTRALLILHRATARSALPALAFDRLAPFLSLQHAQRGLVRGPYVKLPARAQALARGIVVLSGEEKIAAALREAEL